MGHYASDYDEDYHQRNAQRQERLKKMQAIIFHVLKEKCGDSDKDLELVKEMADHIGYMLHKEMR